MSRLAACLTLQPLLCLFMICGAASAPRTVMAQPVYELRIYTTEPGRLDALHERFREHTLDLFEKHGITNLAYWTPAEGPEAENTLIYVIRHESREAANESWAAFRDDPEWRRVRAASEEDGPILAKPPESWYLAPTGYSPEIGVADPDKVYELRIYTAAEGKLPALHRRFAEHTDDIFQDHGMTAYAYWSPLDEPESERKLVYILEHESREAAHRSWRAFSEDPAWRQARAASEVDGKLVDRVERTYLVPTDYTPTE